MQSGVSGRLSGSGCYAQQCYDGSYHEVDSSEMAFKIAGSMAFKEAMRKGGSALLEPYDEGRDVTVPEEYMGDVIGDINSRRGRIEGMDIQKRGIRSYHGIRTAGRKCSVMRPICVLRHRAVEFTPCSSIAMSLCRRAFRKRYWTAKASSKKNCIIAGPFQKFFVNF